MRSLQLMLMALSVLTSLATVASTSSSSPLSTPRGAPSTAPSPPSPRPTQSTALAAGRQQSAQLSGQFLFHLGAVHKLRYPSREEGIENRQFTGYATSMYNVGAYRLSIVWVTRREGGGVKNGQKQGYVICGEPLTTGKCAHVCMA